MLEGCSAGWAGQLEVCAIPGRQRLLRTGWQREHTGHGDLSKGMVGQGQALTAEGCNCTARVVDCVAPRGVIRQVAAIPAGGPSTTT